MPQFDDKHVKICGGTVVWDGVTRPDIQEQGGNAGKPKWTLKVVFDPQNPDVALYHALSTQTLASSQFRGQLPAGGYMPIGVCRPDEFNGLFPGWPVVSFKTTLRCPDVYNEAGQLLDPMQYGPLMFSGQKVDVLAHCYEYNTKSKGIGAGMDAFAIIASAKAPRLEIGGGGIATASAFGGQPPAAQPAYGQPPAQAQPAYGQPPAQAHNFLPSN